VFCVRRKREWGEGKGEAKVRKMEKKGREMKEEEDSGS
jgi:hypothetical protein